MLPHGLGRLVSPIDTRDYTLAAFIPKQLGDLSGSKSWDFPSSPLDQGETNHCVGFAMADFGINLPIQDAYTNQDGHDFYYKCKVLDGEPTNELGTNVRSAAKVLKQMNKISNYAFAHSTDEITYWLLNKGPMIVGTKWTLDMFTPDSDNVIHPTGIVKGGHGYLLNGKMSEGFYHMQNAWNGWGINGGAFISITDFGSLLYDNGEALTAVELPLDYIPTPQSGGCLAAILKLLGMNK